MSELCQQAERAGYVRGTASEQAIVKIFDAMESTFLPAELLRDLLLKDKHTKSTVQRAITRLVTHGNLTKHDGGELELVSRDLPWIQSNASRPGRASNRFGGKPNAERDARFVRETLIDKLDDLFETPNAYLRRVLVAVEWAGRMAQAAIAQDAKGLAAAIKDYRDNWHDAEKNEFLRPLTAARLMEALQVGLFAEEFADDAEVAEQLEANRQEVVDERRKIVETIGAENADLASKNRAIEDANVQRAKNGNEPLPLHKLHELPTKKWADGKLSMNGLIPRGGGERVGAARLRAFLQVVGANKQETPSE